MKPSPPLPTVSVIIPTHNRAELLRSALDSVTAQEGVGERFRLEVLVVDDSSTDHTPEVVRQYGDVRSIRSRENRGTSGARNLGLQEASGDYIAFLDDDDLWLPWKLRRQLDAFRDHDELGVVYGQEIKRGGTDSVSVWPESQDGRTGWMYRSLLTSCPVNTSSVLARKVAVDQAGFFDENLRCWEDLDMWLRIACHWRFAFVPGPAVIYRVAYSGRFLSCVTTGESERDLRIVTEAALQRLEAREPVSDDFRHLIEAALVTRIAGQFSTLGLAGAQRAFLIEAVRKSPWLVRVRDLRWMLSTAAIADGASAAGVDRSRVADFCTAIKKAAGAGGPRLWLGARRIEAEAWKKIAVTLASSGERPGPEARRAAVHALSQHPGAVGKSLLRILAGIVS